MPLLAVVMPVLLLIGGLTDADFAGRLTAPRGVDFVAGWLRMLGFAAAVVCGTAAVRRPGAQTRRRPK